MRYEVRRGREKFKRRKAIVTAQITALIVIRQSIR
jgi:hypothetical protein